jgi:hypothetical protein
MLMTYSSIRQCCLARIIMENRSEKSIIPRNPYLKTKRFTPKLNSFLALLLRLMIFGIYLSSQWRSHVAIFSIY